MTKICESLREHTKKMLPLTKEELKSHQDAKVCYICGKGFLKVFTNDKYYQKVRDQCRFTGKYSGEVHSISNLAFDLPNEMPQLLITVRIMIIISL